MGSSEINLSPEVNLGTDLFSQSRNLYNDNDGRNYMMKHLPTRSHFLFGMEVFSPLRGVHVAAKWNSREQLDYV